MDIGFSLAFHKLITTLTPPFVIKQKQQKEIKEDSFKNIKF
jgi:hypothetical protein